MERGGGGCTYPASSPSSQTPPLFCFSAEASYELECARLQVCFVIPLVVTVKDGSDKGVCNPTCILSPCYLLLRTHHVSLLREDSIMKALWCHPPDGQLDLTLLHLSLPVVVLGIDILAQPKVCHLDDIVQVYPVVHRRMITLPVSICPSPAPLSCHSSLFSPPSYSLWKCYSLETATSLAIISGIH